MRALVIASAMCLSTLGIALATDAQAAVRMPTNIQPQELGSALQTLAKARGFQIVYRPEYVRDRTTSGAAGELTRDEALARILTNTGLSFRYLNENTVTIEPFGLDRNAGSTPTRSSEPEGAIERSSAFWSRLRLAQSDTPFPSQEEGRGEVTAGERGREAQSPKATELEEIVVTGTHLRSQAAPASPVQVYSQTDIDRTGAGTLQDFLVKLPQNSAAGAIPRDTAFITGGSAQNIGFGAGINLRGLGVGTTLTLVNGRRVAAIGNQPFVDISLIPTSAIERVEILTDGASAIYGSDAVGGVVNILMKKDFEGFETSGGIGTVTEGGREEYNASATTGTGWAGGNAMLTYSYLFQDRLQASEKEFSEDVELQPLDLYPRSSSHSVYGRLTQELFSGVEGDLSAMYARRDANGAITSDAGDGILQNDRLDSDTESYSLFAGLTADLPARWQVRLDSGYSKVSTNAQFQTAYTNGDYETNDLETTSDLLTGNVVVEGPLFTLPGGDVSAALGGEYQSTDYALSSLGISDGREVLSAFGEIAVPVFSPANAIAGIEELQLSVALRYDDYSDFGDTANPKFGALWSPVRGLRLRGTYGESFRSPSLAQTNQQVSTSAFRRTTANDVAPPPFIWIAALGGNPDLGPERARTKTIGVEYERDEGPARFSGSVNYYEIDYRDRVERGSPGGNNPIFADPDPFAPILIRNPTLAQIDFYRTLAQQGLGFRVTRTGSSGIPAGQSESDATLIIDNRLRNNAATSQQGIDFIGRVTVPSGAMTFGADFNAQYIVDRTQKITSASPALDAFSQPYLPVDFSFRAGINASYAKWYGSISWNHVDAYENPSSTVAPAIDAWNTFDLYFSYNASEASGFLAGSTAALSITNLLDKAPPFVPADSYGVNYDPANADPLGRFVKLTLSKRW